jgi:hypothetical protein
MNESIVAMLVRRRLCVPWLLLLRLRAENVRRWLKPLGTTDTARSWCRVRRVEAEFPRFSPNVSRVWGENAGSRNNLPGDS